MKILLNEPEEQLKKYFEVTGIKFDTLKSNNIEESVAVVIEGKSYQEYIQEALKLNVPIVAIAGRNKNAEHSALEYGIPDESIIVKEGNIIKNLAGREFCQGRGITIMELVNICRYVQENNLRPELYIWQDCDEEVCISAWDDISKESEQPVDVEKSSETEPQKAVDPEFKIGKVTVKETASNPQSKSSKPQIIERTLDEFLKKHNKILVVFKTTPTTNTAAIAKALADKLKAFHLELAEKSNSYKWYSDNKEKVLLSGLYGHCGGQNISFSNSYSAYNTIILEVDPSSTAILDVLNSVFDDIDIIIHVADSFIEGQKAIQSWLEMKLPLHAIIAESEEGKFRTEYKDLVKTIDEVAQLL